MTKFNTLSKYYLPIIASLFFAGCDKTDLSLPEKESFLPNIKNHRTNYTKTITSFGTTNYLSLDERWELQYPPSIALGDMDNDGDLDIILADARGKITVLENKIPQKQTNFYYLKSSNNP